MIRLTGRVLYLDGTEAEFVAGTIAISAWERYAIRHKLPHGAPTDDRPGAPGALSDAVIAHHALGIAEGFDAWAETVLSVEITNETPAVPPTEPDPSSA